ELINQADALVYTTEKSLKEFGDRISQSERMEIEQKMNDLRTAMKDKDIEKIKKGMEELTRASHRLAEEVYKQTASGKKTETSEGKKSETKEGKKEDIIDAEYEGDDEDKK
ncbi:MAG: Hsp70 family protein, partial [Candidatus Omnitrophica bacterium]|nr:Hsp70 family protein [Candidatus Omnitrophota bacterium]